VRLAEIHQAITGEGLAWRGALHPGPEDAPIVGEARTLVLVGFVGRGHWPTFAASPEAADGAPDPLDRWSRRVIDAIAERLGAGAIFPFGGPPWAPFVCWAQKAEPVYRSPIGILIHPDWGLWHSWRGALAFVERIDLPAPDRRPSPCESCRDKPCLTACPVSAFTPAGYDIAACTDHIGAPKGAECMDRGCRARLACPVGAARRYSHEQAQFHMRAFLNAQRR